MYEKLFDEFMKGGLCLRAFINIGLDNNDGFSFSKIPYIKIHNSYYSVIFGARTLYLTTTEISEENEKYYRVTDPELLRLVEKIIYEDENRKYRKTVLLNLYNVVKDQLGD